MNKLTLPNFNHCKEVLILHERNTNPHYKQLICKLESIQDEKDKVHKPDSEIIVDCHDLSSKKKINIVFVSSDHSLLKFKKEILTLVKIKDMVSLKDIYFKKI